MCIRDSVNTVLSNQQNLNDILPLMDVIINGIYIPGASAPKIIDQALLQQLKNNCLIVDVAIDQGGSVENLTPTSHDDPIVNINQVYGYAVPNMPGVVPRTASKALNEATFPYIEYLANNGVEHSIKNNNEIANGVNTYKNKLTSKPVADSLNLNFSPLDELIWLIMNKNIFVIFGVSGLIGTELANTLHKNNEYTIVITRNINKTKRNYLF